jgi:hypothetical protein
MAKLGDFQTPTGAKGNVFRISDIGSLVLGAIVLIFTFAAGQNLASKLNGKAPFLDGQVEQPWKSPVVANNQKTRNVY